MGLTRIAYNAVVAWNRKRCFFNVDRQKQWLKHQTFEKKCELYSDIEDEDLRKKCVWGERKFLRTVVRIRLSLQGYLNEVPANIIDETVDEALFARANVIKKNAERGDEEGVSRLSFKSKKDLKHTLTIRRQNFSKRHWNQFYVMYLHNRSMYASERIKPNDLREDKRDLRPLHFETKRKKNDWPIPHKINCDCKLTYTRDWQMEVILGPREAKTDP